MAGTDHAAGLVPALLKQWRAQSGLSQLDLALAADVSARHISFLETGRSLPSPDMVLRLAATLGVPLRQVNTMLVAAGHDPVYDESLDHLPTAVAEALELCKSHHEPFPLLVVDQHYWLKDLNHAARALLGVMLGRPVADGHGAPEAGGDINLARLTFDPEGAQPSLVNFDEVGRQLLWRIQREALAEPDDPVRQALLAELLQMPTVAADWREVDLAVPSEPALVLHLRYQDTDLRFLTTITAFQAPQNIAVEQLRIEQWFPFDAETAEACRQLAGATGAAPTSDGSPRR